jgi:hypothetical protein
MTTDTGMTAVGTIVKTTGAETIGVEISGAESRLVEKPNAVVIGSATEIGPSGTTMRMVAATIVVSAKPRGPSYRLACIRGPEGIVVGLAEPPG